MASFIDEASTAIRESGGRFTAQRRLIIELLEASEEHLDAEGLHQLAHKRDESISLATVYRTLNVLEEAGLIDQRYFSPDRDRKYYEPVGASEHYHFTCLQCKQVIEFETDLVNAIKAQIESRLGVHVLDSYICFEGLCTACQATHASKEST